MQIVGISALECREVPEVRRVLLLEPGGDLGEPGVARDERRRAGGSCFGGDHAECLGEDRRHDGHVRERQELREMTMLERPGEERPLAAPSPRASRGTGRSRRRRGGHRCRASPRAGPARPSARSASRSRRRSARRRRGSSARRAALPSSGRRSLALPGFGGSLRASSIRAANASSRGRILNSSTSTPGGTSCTRST